MDIHVSKLTFEVLSYKKLTLTECDIKKLNVVNYDWIINNSWKKITKQTHDFENIYFLHEVGSRQFIQYKVGVTIVSH